MSCFHYDYDEKAHSSVWEVYDSRFAAVRAVEPVEVSHHMVRLAISALKCSLASAEHGITTPQSGALAEWLCRVSPDDLIRITAGAPDQGDIKALIAWHLNRAVRMRSRVDVEVALAIARKNGLDDAVEFVEELRKSFTNEENDYADRGA